MRKTKVTKCENTDMQENAQYIIAFLTEEEGGLSAIVAMICEVMIGVYMQTVFCACANVCGACAHPRRFKFHAIIDLGNSIHTIENF